MILYRIYQIVVMVPLIVVLTILTATFTFTLCILGLGRWAGYWPQVLWARCFCWLAWVKVRVRGRGHISRGRAYLFVANHQGAYDIFSIYGYLGHNFRWMMKESLRKIPFVGFACAASKQIFVDNKSVGGVRKTMEAAEKQLAGGMSLVVFPEGQRTWNGKMNRFKKGAYKLAMEFNLPVVPITIDGAYKVMPRTAKLPRPGTITLTIHNVIEPPAEGYDLDDLMARTYQAISSGLA